MDHGDSHSDNPRFKVNAAIQRGLRLCRHSVAPIVSLAVVVDELHADPTWDPREVRQVETRLRKMLARLVKMPD
jgi:hypothetical protein